MVANLNFGGCNFEAVKVVNAPAQEPFTTRAQLNDLLSVLFDDECDRLHRRIPTLFKATITIRTENSEQEVLILWGGDGKDGGVGFERDGQDLRFDNLSSTVVIAVGNAGAAAVADQIGAMPIFFETHDGDVGKKEP